MLNKRTMPKIFITDSGDSKRNSQKWTIVLKYNIGLCFSRINGSNHF